jgi:hypothetical protein
MRKLYSLIILCAVTLISKAQTVASYAFSQTTGTYTPITGGTVIATATAASGATSLDDVIYNLPNGTIPFNFTYNGTAYTGLNVSANGFVAFGATAPAGDSYTPISSTTGYNGAISAVGRDLNSLFSISGNTGELRYETIGSAPNRVFVIQYKNFRPFSSSTSTTTYWRWNFQIQLAENGTISFVYDFNLVGSPASGTAQVGLRGSGNTDFNNRLSTTSWTTTSTGGTNAATLSYSTAILPPSGLTFTYTPPAACTGTPAAAVLSSTVNACNGSSTIITASNLPSGVSGITYQWEESPDGVSGWTNVTGGSGATTSSYTTPAITATKYYRLVVSCTPSAQSSTSNVSTITPVNCQFDVTRSSASYSSISATGTSMSGWRNGNSTDDNLSTAQNIGFSFTYKGLAYTQFSTSTNGYLTFNVGTVAVGSGTGAYGYENNIYASTTGTLNTLAPFYEDLVTQGNPATAAGLAAAIKYQLSGSPGSQILTIEWIGMETFGNAGPNLNFQIKLYEGSNKIEYIYGAMEGFNGTSDFGFTYTLGLNASVISGSPTLGELQVQQIENVQNFAATAKANLAAVPSCSSMYTFIPGAYSGAASNPGAPSNDDPTAPVDLVVNSSACVSYCGTYYSSKNATATASIPVCTAGTPGTPDDDVWFRFTATNANQTITVRGSGGYNSVVQLLDNSFASVACVNATGAGLTEAINATGLTAGNVYYVRVYHSGTGSTSVPTLPSFPTVSPVGSGEFSICINGPVTPPANDDPCGAILLTLSNTCTPYSDNSANSTTSIVNATTTSSNGVTTPACTGAGASVNDVWFKFVATSTTHGITATSVPGFDVAVQAYTVAGDCASSNLVLTSAGCVNGASTGGTEQIIFTTTVGQTYYLRLYRHPSGASGAPVSNSQFSICVFNPIPTCTTNSAPANNATNVSLTPTLTWAAATYATSYDVYLGTSVGTATLQGNATTTSYVVSTNLATNTQYFWYVIPKNLNGSATGCDLSNATSFTTTSVACAAPTSVSVGSITGNSASVTFTSTGSAFIVEYGPAGFTPGTGNTAGAGGTIVIGTASPIALSGLTGGTSYDVYVRQDCNGAGNGYSANSTLANFITGADAPNCATSPVVTECTPVVASIPAGTGAWSFAGTYPNNSVGFSTPGRELVYRFTPTTTGVYYLEITNAPGTGYIDYFYKPASGGCANTGWIGIDDNNATGKDAIGMLQAGVEYYLLLDPESSTSAPTQTFQICKATTVAPSTLNACVSTVILGGSIPANSTKIEYVIDAAGNLIASLDFSAVSNAVGTVTTSYYVNGSGNPLRRDGNRREYLDRNFTITTGTAPASPVGVTLYFLNSELQTLINDPDDGNADVSSISDLRVTKTSETCAQSNAVSSGGTLLTPTATGAFDATVSYVTVQVSSFSTFYLHGGLGVLPANLLSFSGVRKSNANHLKWTVAQELAVESYELERSENGRTWSKVGVVASLGNTTAQRTYNFADNNISGTKQLYRLRQLDRNGSQKLSNTVVITGEKAAILAMSGLFPNPAATQISLLIDAPAKDNLSIVVIDAVGRIVKAQKASVGEGSNTLQVNVTGLSQGSYVVRVTSENTMQIVVNRFVKE